LKSLPSKGKTFGKDSQSESNIQKKKNLKDNKRGTVKNMKRWGWLTVYPPSKKKHKGSGRGGGGGPPAVGGVKRMCLRRGVKEVGCCWGLEAQKTNWG